MKFGFFWPLRFLCQFGRFKDDFGRFLGTGRFLDTVSGHRMINFRWKLCTIIYNFLFCCFTLIDLQFQVTLQQNQKFIDGVNFILFMYKICTYCLSKAHLGVLNVSLCIYRVFGFFRCYLAFFKGWSWSGLFCSWLLGNPDMKLRLEKLITYFQPRKRRNVENNHSNCPLNIRFVTKTSAIRNFSQNIRSDVKTSEVATLSAKHRFWISLVVRLQMEVEHRGRSSSRVLNLRSVNP